MAADVEERALLRESYKRFAHKPARNEAQYAARVGDMLGTRFDKQLSLIHSKRKRKAALCTRRAGKTESTAAYLYKTAFEYPDTVLNFVAITGKRAFELVWKALGDFNNRFAFGAKPNKTLRTIYLPSGSEIRLVGADNLSELEKRRGDKSSLCLVDECQSFPSEILQALVDDVMGPTLEDVGGTLLLLGTPGPVCQGYWYETTRNEDEVSRGHRRHGFEVHEWSVLDNPHMAHMQARLPEMKAERGWGDAHPTWLREWCGRWVNDATALFYSYSEARHAFDGELPEGHKWRYVTGVDLGHDDDFAIVTWAFARTTPFLWEAESFKKPSLIPSQWAEEIEKRVTKYKPEAVVVDTGGLGKAFVEEMKQRHRLPVKPAEKKNKHAFVTLLNGDLDAGRIRVKRRSLLAGEWSVLPKDPDDPTQPAPGMPDHCSDAALYGWRESRHFLGVTPEAAAEPGSEDWHKAKAKAIEDALATRMQEQMAQEQEEKEWEW